ncbi:FeS cluster assembly protein SufD [Thalassocella blandensis]|nr:FeS cluster assembly protein SufD [Thalassocella blandensis]
MLDIQQTLIDDEAGPSWLADFQTANNNLWSSQNWPTRKTESWKYTSLKAIETGGYRPRSAINSGSDQAQANGAVSGSVIESVIASSRIEGLETIDVVFVNGAFSPSLSSVDTLPSGVELCLFSQANSQQQADIREHLGSVAKAEQHVFVALNGGQLKDGVFVKVQKNTVVDNPVRVLWITTQQKQSLALAQRLLVVVEEGAKASIVEQFVSSEEEQNCFTHGVTELVLQDNSKLFHYRLHQEQEKTALVSGVHAKLLRSATLESFYLAFGGTIKRLDVVVDHQGQGAHCEMNGVYLPRNSQHVDFHTCIEHAVPHCTTNEVFRGIIGDSAKAVFNGRIHIHKDAQKTLAQLSNKNLLTSNKAEIDTKPELEIYADDVQCAHGATVAQLDEMSLHYLRTRGVSTEEAKVMLSFGFINALVDQVHHQAIANYLRPILANLFAQDPELMRHIA